jgi:peptide deformylase
MVVREALLVGNPLLRKKSEYVADFGLELHPVLEDLKDTLTRHQEITGSGRGLAAPQLGYLKRVVRIQTPDYTSFLVNPEIIWKSDEMFNVWDSCFSFKGAFFVKIKRHKKIRVGYQDEKGQKHIKEFTDALSELLQHEIDHLDGIMCSDHLGDPKDIAMREEWEKRYRIPGIGM